MDDDERNQSDILIERPGDAGTGRDHRRPGGGTGAPGAAGRRVAVALVAALVVLVGIVVVVRLAGSSTDDGGPAGNGGGDAAATTGHRVGDCVVSDAGGPAGTAPVPSAGDGTRVVPCTEPHLLEITGEAQLDDEPGSLSAQQWQDLVDTRCTGPAEAYLGGRLDPDGRYRVTVLAPDPAAWRRGERTLWCGLAANWLDPAVAASTPPSSGGTGRARPATLFTDSVKDRSQFWTYRAGDCVGPLSRAVLPCSAPHEYEVTGELTLPNRDRPPLDTGEGSWEDVVAEPCATKARAYLGRDPADPWASGWVPVSAASWAAGKRTVTCFVGRYENGEWASVTGPAPR